MRAIGARVLTILAILLALVGMIAFYVEHTALDEDGFETISRNMIENDEIRTQVAAKSVDTLFDNVDVEAAIAERLPPAQQGLAPVLAGLARSGADRAADAALERPRVQTVWVEATTRTQRQLVRLLDDDTTFIQTEGGAVVLDLRPIVIELGDQVAVIGQVAERLPSPRDGSRSSRRASWRRRRRSRSSCARWPTGCGSWHSPSPLSPWLAADAAGSSFARSRWACSSSGSCSWRYAASPATTSSTSSRRTTPSSRRLTMRGTSLLRSSPTAPGCGSFSESSRSRRLARRRDSSRRGRAPRRSAGPREPGVDVCNRGRRLARARAGRSGHRAGLAVGARPDRAHRRRHRGRPSHRPARSPTARLKRALGVRGVRDR